MKRDRPGLIRKAIAAMLAISGIAVLCAWASSYRQPRFLTDTRLSNYWKWGSGVRVVTLQNQPGAFFATLTLEGSGFTPNPTLFSRAGLQLDRLTMTPITIYQLRLPHWQLASLLFLYPMLSVTIRRIHKHRSRNRGLCLRCGYNLTGNTSGICPECGTTIAHKMSNDAGTS